MSHCWNRQRIYQRRRFHCTEDDAGELISWLFHSRLRLIDWFLSLFCRWDTEKVIIHFHPICKHQYPTHSFNEHKLLNYTKIIAYTEGILCALAINYINRITSPHRTAIVCDTFRKKKKKNRKWLANWCVVNSIFWILWMWQCICRTNRVDRVELLKQMMW